MHVLHDDLLPLFHTLRQINVVHGGATFDNWYSLNGDASDAFIDVAFMDDWDPEDYFELAEIVVGKVKIYIVYPLIFVPYP